MRVTLELVRALDGRLVGTAATETGAKHPFSGTLELLRVLEELEPRPRRCEPGPGVLPGSPR